MNAKIVRVVVSLILLLAAAPHSALSSVQAGGLSCTGSYVVQRGETLSRIAATLRVDVNLLALCNGLSVNRRLRAGQRLRTPAPPLAVISLQALYPTTVVVSPTITGATPGFFNFRDVRARTQDFEISESVYMTDAVALVDAIASVEPVLLMLRNKKPVTDTGPYSYTLATGDPRILSSLRVSGTVPSSDDGNPMTPGAALADGQVQLMLWANAHTMSGTVQIPFDITLVDSLSTPGALVSIYATTDRATDEVVMGLVPNDPNGTTYTLYVLGSGDDIGIPSPERCRRWLAAAKDGDFGARLAWWFNCQ